MKALLTMEGGEIIEADDVKIGFPGTAWVAAQVNGDEGSDVVFIPSYALRSVLLAGTSLPDVTPKEKPPARTRAPAPAAATRQPPRARGTNGRRGKRAGRGRKDPWREALFQMLDAAKEMDDTQTFWAVIKGLGGEQITDLEPEQLTAAATRLAESYSEYAQYLPEGPKQEKPEGEDFENEDLPF